MLDIKLLRENPELVKKAVENKNEKADVDKILALDNERRSIISKVEELKAQKNKVSAEVGKLKRSGENADELIAEMKKVADEIKEMDDKLRSTEQELNELLAWVPNLPHESVPVGKSADDNVEVRRWTPDGYEFDKKDFMLDHLELGKKLGILDFERGAKISGSGFPVYVGKGATLERALINYMLDVHINQHNYTEVFPPFLVNRDSMKGTGQIPKLEEDMYHCSIDDLFPIPTAEVPVTNLHRNEILRDGELPKNYVAFSACFRREAGSHGKESKGFLRVHQFNKVEMVKIVEPENSYDHLEQLVSDAEDILKALNVPYRILLLCTGDLSFSAAKCYDIETWSPAEQKWLESSSCSNFEDFQARRASIRFKYKDMKKPQFAHTLNGSGLATSRLMVSLLENNQTPDGKIIVPEPLRKYTGFDVIE
ncbi:MAG: serine--tRNA ligase [Ignavibacteria bacterium]|nr:MAG: serine--tRNA ligase [Ignavibacteria bacterium]